MRQRELLFRFLTEQMDTTTSGGKLIFHMFGALAEIQRNLSRKRTVAALHAARARRRLGGRPKLSDTDRRIQIARQLHADLANSIADICATIRISPATLYRYLVQCKDASVDSPNRSEN